MNNANPPAVPYIVHVSEEATPVSTVSPHRVANWTRVVGSRRKHSSPLYRRVGGALMYLTNRPEKGSPVEGQVKSKLGWKQRRDVAFSVSPGGRGYSVMLHLSDKGKRENSEGDGIPQEPAKQ